MRQQSSLAVTTCGLFQAYKMINNACSDRRAAFVFADTVLVMDVGWMKQSGLWTFTVVRLVRGFCGDACRSVLK